VKTKGELLAELDRIVAEKFSYQRVVGNLFVVRKDNAKCQYWLSRTIAVLESFLPASSSQLAEVSRLAKRIYRQGGYLKDDIDAFRGHLRFVRDAVDGGLLRSMRNEVSAADCSDFLSHARYYHSEGKKMEASVIAAAVFEDAIKRLGESLGVDGATTLDSTINALKSNGVFTSIEAKRLRYFAGIRNSALHASWDEFDMSAVGDLIDGVERLLSDLAKTP
jgi:hypothetical protein